MSAALYIFDVGIDGDYITVKWHRQDDAAHTEQYPELHFSFNYRDISSDTVSAMLSDMLVPAPLYDSIMTRVTADLA